MLTEEQRANIRWPSRTVRNAKQFCGCCVRCRSVPQAATLQQDTAANFARGKASREKPQKSGRRADFAHDAIYRGQKLMPVRPQGIASTTLALHLLAPKRDEAE